VGDPADFIVINDTQHFDILQTYIDGRLVAENGKTLLPVMPAAPINNFMALPKKPADFAVKATAGKNTIRVIEAIEGQLVTNELQLPAKIENGLLVSDTDNDILKIAVVNRYTPEAPVAIAFIKNFGLKQGAIASTVGHDCHNIIAVGVSDEAICTAVNALITYKGGVAATDDEGKSTMMPLPVAGLMSLDNGYDTAAQYISVDTKAKELGTTLHAPFMTLSFMALLVIPALKLSDKGLFDGSKFSFTDVMV
jgi:adenine deaminase